MPFTDAPSTTDPTNTDPAAAPRRARRTAWLIVGAAAAILAAPGPLQVPLLIFVAIPAMIVWGRSASSWRAALAGQCAVWGASTVWTFLSAALADVKVLDPTILALSIMYLPLNVVPMLADRWLARSFRDRPLLASLGYPTVRVIGEYAFASLMPLGGVLGLLGSSQAEFPALIQLASVTGVWGVSFMIGWVGSLGAGVLLGGLRSAAARRWFIGLAALAAVIIGGSIRLAVADLVPAERVRVASISVPAELRNTDTGSGAVARTEAMVSATERELEAGAKIVSWSEAAGLTRTQRDHDALLARIGDLAARHDAWINLGLGHGELTSPEAKVRNLSVLVGPDGSVVWTYDKARPIPGLEDNLTAGDGKLPIAETPYGRLTTMICYDTDFPSTARAAGGADILLSPTFDWPGIERLHAMSATLRSVETGVQFVRSTAGGWSMIIDGNGRWRSVTPDGDSGQTVVLADVSTRGVRTVYAVLGDWFPAAAGLGLAGLLAAAVIGRRRAR